MLKLSIDLSELRSLAKRIDGIEPRLDSLYAEALNKGGERLYDLVQRYLASRYKLHWAQIDTALDFIPATEGAPLYRLSFSNARFPYRKWITQRDEKVCKICGPRDGQIFHTADLIELFPAHPNCRCRLEKLDLSNAFKDMPPSIVDEPANIAAEAFLEAFASMWNSL